MVYQSQEDSGLCPTLFVFTNIVLFGTVGIKIDMETRLIDKLMAIPADASTATIQGIEMQIISTEQADKMLESDTNDERIHECILKNGRFLFESENGKLTTLYKVQN